MNDSDSLELSTGNFSFDQKLCGNLTEDYKKVLNTATTAKTEQILTFLVFDTMTVNILRNMTFVQNHLCQLNASFALLNKILYYLIGLLSESCRQIANYTSTQS